MSEGPRGVQYVGKNIQVPMKVRSPEYGTGTVVANLGIGIQIYWDTALTGTTTHLLVHDYSFVERLEKLPPEEQA